MIAWRSLAAAALAASSLAPARAHADDEGEEVWEEEPPPIYVPELRSAPRKLIGFDFGLGVYDGFCARCLLQGGLSAGFQVGVQVAHRVAVVFDLWSLLHLLPSDNEDERGLTTHTIATAAARVWLGPTLWLQSGVGAGAFTVVGPVDDAVFGPAATIVLGRELRHRASSGIDLSLKLGGTWFSQDGEQNDGDILYNLAGAIGYHWN